VLSALDAKIEINNKINAELEQMAKTLYDYWFVQFDFPDASGKPYKSSGGKMIWNDELKKEIPVEWDSGNLFNNPFIEIIKPGINKFDGFKKYLATADINDREVGSGTDITYEKRESRANMQPIKNSIWFAKMKASKKHLFIGQDGDDFVYNYILSTGFMGLKCEDFAFEFISSFIASDNFEIIKNTISHGATMQGIGNDDLKLIKIVIPSENILLKYKELTSPMYLKMEMIRLENKKLSELRDWLLPMLMNGQVRVI
jgi:type I restriction enzyme, S subunit